MNATYNILGSRKSLKGIDTTSYMQIYHVAMETVGGHTPYQNSGVPGIIPSRWYITDIHLLAMVFILHGFIT